jgi:hypothetical protein
MTAETIGPIPPEEEDILNDGVVESLIAAGRVPTLVDVLMDLNRDGDLQAYVICLTPPRSLDTGERFIKTFGGEGFILNADGKIVQRAQRRLLSVDEGEIIRSRIEQASQDSPIS